MQPEHQEHLGGPPADALHLRQRGDDPFIVERIERVEPDRAAGDLVAQIAEVFRFLAADARRI